jgi:hypothetical protein
MEFLVEEDMEAEIFSILTLVEIGKELLVCVTVCR